MTNESASPLVEGTRRSRRGRRLWIILLTVTVLGAVALDRTYRYAVRPERLVRLTEEHLSRFFTGKISIGDARLALFEGIRLTDVTIDLPESAGDRVTGSDGQERPPVFSCRRVELRHRPLDLLVGKLRIDSVTAFEPRCTIVHDDETGRTNISKLLRPGISAAVGRWERTPSPGKARPDLPTVELSRASIKVYDRHNGALREVENLAVTIRARPAADNADRYDVVWNAHGVDPTRKAQEDPVDSVLGGHSQIDLNTGYVRNIRGGLPSMSIEAVMLAVNARYDGVGAWTNLLGLGGRVRAVDYNLIDDPDGEDDRSVTIELTDAAISIPVDATEHPLPHDQRYLRFAHVNGTVVATTRSLRAEFAGDFHGSHCTVRATLRSDLKELRSLDDVDFDVELTANSLRVPRIDDDAPTEQVRFVRRFRALANAYEDFDPHGVVDLNVHASKKAGIDEPVHLQSALINILDGDAAFEHFRYRGYNMTGSIEFLPEGVFVRDLRGERNGGLVTINGWMAAPSKCAELKFDITGENILIDEALLQALEPEQRHTAMRFAPQGRLDIGVDLLRSACERDEQKGQWSTTVTLHLQGNQATYEDFPYPVEALTGTIVIGPERARVVDVRGTPRITESMEPTSAETGAPRSNADHASVRIYGDLLFSQGKVTDIDLIVRGTNIPVDEKLKAALPEAMGNRLRAFRAEGNFHCQTRLALDPLDQTMRYESKVSLDGLSVRHELLPVTFSDVMGTLRIEPHRIHAEEISARYRDSAVMVKGSIDPREPEQHTSLSIEAGRIELDEEIRNVLSEKWRLLGDWIVEGPMDLVLEVRADDANVPREHESGESNPWTVTGAAHIDGVKVHYKDGPFRFADVNGVVSFNPDVVRGRKLTGRFNEATVQLDFDLKSDEVKQEGTFRIAASKLHLGPHLRNVLPERLRSAWDGIAPQGPVDLRVDRLEFVQSKSNGPPIWKGQGRIDLHDVDLRGESAIEAATGFLTFGGTLSDRLGGCVVSGRLHLERANLFQRQIRQYQSDWSLVQTAEGEGRFMLSRAQAELYDGFIAGDLEVMTGSEKTTYNLSTTIQRAQLELMLNDERPLSPQLVDRVTVNGLLDVQLYLAGVLGDKESQRGGGRMELTAGHIYKLPIMSAILHVLNLSLPLESSLESAQASFFVVGSRVDLPSVALRGSGLELVGSGAMTLPDYTLDLTLVSVNPRRWARVPVLSDLVEGASREFVALHVTGPIGRPTVRTRPMAAFNDEFKRLFQRRETPTVRAVPAAEQP